MKVNSEKTLIEKCNPILEAYEKLPKGKAREFREKAKEIFGVKSDQAIYLRIRCGNEPRVSQARELEGLFQSYGVLLTWGCKE